MKYLLDTNIISEIISKSPNEKVLKFLEKNKNNLYLSVITIGEINAGIEKLDNSKRKDKLKLWLQDLLQKFEDKILDIDIYVMLLWGEISTTLKKQGITISIMDCLIASCAIKENMILVTRNEKDFKDIKNLIIINPFKG